MAENNFASWPVALYSFVLLCAAIAYFILVRILISTHGADSVLAIAVGNDFKGKVSMMTYAVAVPFSFVNSWTSVVLFVLVAIMWLVPDRRIERIIK
jgi:uncharacterized membrane protein